jgi:integrase
MARPFNPLFAPLTDSWSSTLLAVEGKHKLSNMRVLASYASSRGIEPSQVDDSLLVELESAAKAKMLPRPVQLIRTIKLIWNACVRTCPGWPIFELSVVSRRKNPSVLLSALSASFQEDLAGFMNRSSNGGRFTPRRRGPRSPKTKMDVQQKVLQIVTMLAKRGWTIEDLVGLKDLLAQPALDAILDEMWAEGAGAECGHNYNRIRLLKGIAKDWARCDAEIIDLLKEAERAFREKNDGMVDSNRTKLRAFTDDSNIRRLVNLPSNTVAALHPQQPTLGEAIVVQSALAVALLLVAPVRAKNLAAIDLTKHLHRISDTNCYLVFPDHEVKNRINLEYPLPLGTIQLLDLYLTVYRPLLLQKETHALFISRTARQKTETELGAQIPRFIKEHLGIHLNLHLFRHLAAFIYLKRHPGDYETVRRLLGHKSIRTTTLFYTGLEHRDAFTRFDAIIDSYMVPPKGVA